MGIAPFDLLVLAVYLAGTVLLGLWIGRGQRSLDSYLLGGRNLPCWLVLGSIVATETSTVTFLSVPGIAFDKQSGDLRFLQLAMGYIVGRTVIVFLLLPQFFRGRLSTAYEVLHHRFGGATQRTASLVFLVTRNLGDGLRLFLTAVALRAAAGWSLPLCIGVIGAATIVYTVFGGMKSVVWNDCLQLVIYMVGGLLVGAVLLERLPGGWQQLNAFAGEHDKFRVFEFGWAWKENYTFWAGLIGGAFLTLGTHGTDQLMVQRYLGARSQRAAGTALFASGVVVFFQFALFLLLGVGLACFYQQVRPEVNIARADEALATFVVQELPRNAGLVGLLLAAIFAAAMSTLSSSLNSSASAVTHDFLKRRQNDAAAETRLLPLSRAITMAFGLVQMGVALVAMYISRSVVNEALAIAGFSAGLLLGLFLLGVLTKTVDQRAALVGLIVGLLGLVWIKFVAPHWDWQVAWPWLPVFGSLLTFTTGLAASRVLPRRESGEEK